MKTTRFDASLRRFSLLILSTFVLLQTPRLAAVLPVLDSAVNPANGHIGLLLNTSTWTTAQADATIYGGHLVTINDLAENQWVWNQWGTGRSLWIGFNDAAVEGTFVWSSGAPTSFSHWRPGEPNDGNAGEDYAYIMSTGLSGQGFWNDYENNASVSGQPNLFGVVEIVPEPASGSFLALGGVAAWLARRTRSQRNQS